MAIYSHNVKWHGLLDVANTWKSETEGSPWVWDQPDLQQWSPGQPEL